jgi:hypothetical protein
MTCLRLRQSIDGVSTMLYDEDKARLGVLRASHASPAGRNAFAQTGDAQMNRARGVLATESSQMPACGRRSESCCDVTPPHGPTIGCARLVIACNQALVRLSPIEEIIDKYKETIHDAHH